MAESKVKSGKGMQVALIAVGVLVAIIGVVTVAMRPKPQQLPPSVQGVSLNTGTPGAVKDDTTLDTPEMRKKMVEADKETSREKETKGVSSVSTTAISSLQDTPAQQPKEDKHDALTEAEATARLRQAQQSYSAETDAARKVKEDHLKMVNFQVEQMMKKWDPKSPMLLGSAPIPKPQTTSTGQNSFTSGNNVGLANGVQQTAQSQQTQNQQQAKKTIIIRAGQKFAASLDMSGATNGGNSTMTATLLSGPYINTVLMGKLATSGANRDEATITFNTGAFPGGTIKINAIAMDSTGKNTNVASWVDRKYFERFVVRPFSAMTGALADAIKQRPASTTITGLGATTTSSSGLSSVDIARTGVAKGLEMATKGMDSGNVNPVAHVEPTDDSNQLITILFMEDVSI